jgi:hypothetical protein
MAFEIKDYYFAIKDYLFFDKKDNLIEAKVSEVRFKKKTDFIGGTYIKNTAKKKVVEVTENISFEFMKYLKAIDQMIREASRIASTEIDPHASSTMIDPNVVISMNMNNKNRIQAIQLLLEIYKHRLEVITGGPRSTHDHNGMTLMDHGYDIKQQMKTPEERHRDQARIVLGDLAADMSSLK